MGGAIALEDAREVMAVEATEGVEGDVVGVG